MTLKNQYVYGRFHVKDFPRVNTQKIDFTYYVSALQYAFKQIIVPLSDVLWCLIFTALRLTPWFVVYEGYI